MASNNPRPTKAERRAAARAQAQAMREEQERKDRRTKITRRSLLAGGAVVIAGGAAYAVTRDDDSSDSTISQGKANKSDFPKIVLKDGSWTYGAGPKAGATNSGAKVLDVYFDYSCHYCAVFEDLHSDEITKLINDKKITLALHPCKILGQDWTDQVMNAMGTVLDEAPEKALDFHTKVFALFYKIYQSQDTSLMTVDNIVSTAQDAGVPSSVTSKFADAISANKYGEWTTQGTKVFSDKGFSGTPTVVLDGKTLDLATIGTATGLTDTVSGASSSATDGATEQATVQSTADPSGAK